MRLVQLIQCLSLVGLSLIINQSSVGAGGAPVMGVPVVPAQVIPDKPFTSWSLFLVCDPKWLIPGQEAALGDLSVRYKAFGDTTGPNHAAVWFEEAAVIPELIGLEDGKAILRHRIPGSVDVSRNVYYCRIFGLVPSEGPHIVITTVHPDRW